MYSGRIKTFFRIKMELLFLLLGLFSFSDSNTFSFFQITAYTLINLVYTYVICGLYQSFQFDQDPTRHPIRAETESYLVELEIR